MSDRINSPHGQPGPVAFVVVCVIGGVAAIRGMLLMPAQSDQWWTGVLIFVTMLAGFAIIIGGWLYIQREVDFEADSIRVRRWLEVLRGKSGLVLPLEGTRSAIVLENVRSLRLEHDGFERIQLTLGYWDLRQTRRLVEMLHDRGIPLAQYWEGVYPPGTG